MSAFKPYAHAQYGKLVLVVVLVLRSKGPYCCGNIAAHDVSLRAQTGEHFLRTQNVSEQNQKHIKM